MALDINPLYTGLERSCPRDSKNVSYVEKGLVWTCLDQKLWVGGLCDYRVRFLALAKSLTTHTELEQTEYKILMYV